VERAATVHEKSILSLVRSLELDTARDLCPLSIIQTLRPGHLDFGLGHAQVVVEWAVTQPRASERKERDPVVPDVLGPGGVPGSTKEESVEGSQNAASEH